MMSSRKRESRCRASNSCSTNAWRLKANIFSNASSSRVTTARAGGARSSSPSSRPPTAISRRGTFPFIINRQPPHKTSHAGNEPELRMAISLKPEHLKRYKDIALLLVKYGRADLVKSAGLDATIEGASDGQVSPAKMEELASDIEKLGPTFIKLAQLMSTRADLLPQA